MRKYKANFLDKHFKCAILSINHAPFFGLYNVRSVDWFWGDGLYSNIEIVYEERIFKIPIDKIEYISGYIEDVKLRARITNDYSYISNVKREVIKMPRILKFFFYLAIVVFVWRLINNLPLEQIISKVFGL